MGRRRHLAVLVGLLCAVGAARADDARVVAVEPARDDGRLVCHLATSGLPGERILSTLNSGMASAVDLDLTVLDPRGRVVAANLVRLRLAYDLWDEAFTVSASGAGERLSDARALEAWLDDLPWLPVAPLSALAGSGPHRIRAALRLHVIAPDTRDEVAALVAGPEGQEVSVGLGSLIRMFYDKDDGRTDLEGAMMSTPFHREELRDAPD